MNGYFAIAVASLLALFVAGAPAHAGADADLVAAYYDALNAKDIDKAMSFIAPDAVFINPNGTFSGAAEIKQSLEEGFAVELTFNLGNFREDAGRVVYDYEVLVAGEIVETGTDGLTIVKDGKIVFDGTERSEVK